MNATPEISPAPLFWDGESIYITGYTDEGLPVLLAPADKPEAPETDNA